MALLFKEQVIKGIGVWVSGGYGLPASMYMVQYSYKPPKFGFAKKTK